LDIQVPARDFRAEFADLLANCLSHRLADALRLQDRGIRSLADLDTCGEDGSQKRAGEEPAPVIVHLVLEPGSARAIVPFKSAKSETGTIRENDPPPDGL
jgi:hypothetical protein